jgi:asparagine synthase (glutamine-hydrolysing)
MCGVLAVWNRNGAPVDLAALARGVTSLRHRGPDDEGYVLIDTRTGRAVACAGRDTRPDVSLPALESVRAQPFDLALGHRRLSILDGSRAGHQPMSTADGAIWISFNGTIYNFAEIRARLEALGRAFRSRTDTEVVLRAYEEWGTDCVRHFNGMWAFALWDGRARRLFVSRDRLGIKPLVYHVGETVAVVGSELKGLTAFPSVPREIDAEALHHYLSLMNVPAPFTIYAHARKLLPGHSLVVEARSVTDRAHWRPEPRPGPAGGAGAVEELHDLLRDSVRLQLVGDAPVGTLLSGGVDSSVVTALAATMTRPAALPTYHLTFPGAFRGDESPWAERVSAELSTEHHRVPMAPDALSALPELVALFDEPFAVSSAIGVHLLAREASKRVKVLLTGDGGDEVFAGYVDRYARVDALWDGAAGAHEGVMGAARRWAAGERVRWEALGPLARARAVARALSRSADAGRDASFNLRKLVLNDAEKRALYTSDWRARTRGLSTLSWLGARLPPRAGDRLARWQLHDITTSLPDEMLAKADKATMACGVEARVPLLDHRLVEFALGLPAGLKLAEGEGKRILKQLGERYVPREALYRDKHGFDVPVSEWCRGVGRAFVRDALSPSALRRAGVLRPRAVDRVIAHHEARPGFASSHMVFTLLCFQAWHDVCHRRTA